MQGLTHTDCKQRRNKDRYLIQPLEDESAVLRAVADSMGGVAPGVSQPRLRWTP
ncbi:MAG: hypothetical protein K9K64_15180 [Desulfohalobiaceae bacterium]|nr:hypothetical protein [Desulfohalobiaceae bacterium]